MAGQAVGTAALGLGVWNLVRSIRADRVTLELTPSAIWRLSAGNLSVFDAAKVRPRSKELGPPLLAIEVLNLSKFKVIITEVGLCGRHGPKRGPRRAIVQPVAVFPDGPFPRELESRASVTVIAPVEIYQHVLSGSSRAYALTRCNHRASASSPLLTEIWRAVDGHVR